MFNKVCFVSDVFILVNERNRIHHHRPDNIKKTTVTIATSTKYNKQNLTPTVYETDDGYCFFSSLIGGIELIVIFKIHDHMQTNLLSY